MDPLAIQRARPLPATGEDVTRWQHTARRSRILSGRFEEDLWDWMHAQYGRERLTALGPPDMSANFLASVSRALSTLYLERPIVDCTDGDASPLLGADVEINGRTVRQRGYLERAGLWSIMARVQQWTLAMGECAVHVDYSARTRSLVYHPVTPDYLIAESIPEDPSKPMRIAWLRERWSESAKTWMWTWDDWDLRDVDEPAFRVRRALTGVTLDDSPDITGEFFDGESYVGDGYTWRRSDRSPFLPWALYHREQQAQLWNPYEWREAVDGTLSLCCLWSFWAHCIHDASWPQRYVIGGHVKGLQPDADGQVRTMPTDPSSVLEIEVDETNTAQAIAGQWQTASDPKVLGEAIAAYEARQAELIGVDPGQLVKQSGDPRSGYALAVSAEAKAESRRRYSPIFQPVDELLVEASALLLNRRLELGLPESGYVVQHSLPGASPVGVGGVDVDDAAVGVAAVAGVAVADTALNGAQAAELREIVSAVAAGTIPRDSGVEMIKGAFPALADDADAIMGAAGKSFKPATESTA